MGSLNHESYTTNICLWCGMTKIEGITSGICLCIHTCDMSDKNKKVLLFCHQATYTHDYILFLSPFVLKLDDQEQQKANLAFWQ